MNHPMQVDIRVGYSILLKLVLSHLVQADIVRVVLLGVGRSWAYSVCS